MDDDVEEIDYLVRHIEPCAPRDAYLYRVTTIRDEAVLVEWLGDKGRA
jgi:hypothetical protein